MLFHHHEFSTRNLSSFFIIFSQSSRTHKVLLFGKMMDEFASERMLKKMIYSVRSVSVGRRALPGPAEKSASLLLGELALVM